MPLSTSTFGELSDKSLKADFRFLCKFDHNVLRLDLGSAHVRYENADGLTRFSKPDFLVRYRRDIKPAAWMPHLLCQVRLNDDISGDWRNLRRHVQAMRVHAHSRGWDFRILTETEIRTPFLDNARFLDPYMCRADDVAGEELLLQWMEEFQQTDPETLLAVAARDRTHQVELTAALWRLVACKRIICDLTRPLTMKSEIWVRDLLAEDFARGVYPPVRRD